jgi:nucleoside-triphosphatase THEP1
MLLSTNNILLTGLPRVGKTTVVQKTLARLKAKCGGFYTQALDPAARLRDFKLVTFEGNNRQISRKHLIRRFELDSRIGLDLADLETKGVAAIERALLACQVVAIDEIGRHEALSVPLQQAVLAALASDRPVLATVPLYGTPFIEGLKRRPDVTVLEVTTENRCVLPDLAASRLDHLVRARFEKSVAIEAAGK